MPESEEVCGSRRHVALVFMVYVEAAMHAVENGMSCAFPAGAGGRFQATATTPQRLLLLAWSSWQLPYDALAMSRTHRACVFALFKSVGEALPKSVKWRGKRAWLGVAWRALFLAKVGGDDNMVQYCRSCLEASSMMLAKLFVKILTIVGLSSGGAAFVDQSRLRTTKSDHT